MVKVTREDGTTDQIRDPGAPECLVRTNLYATQFHPELDGAALGHRLGFYVGHGYFATEELERLRAWALTQDVSPSWAVLRNFVAVHAR